MQVLSGQSIKIIVPFNPGARRQGARLLEKDFERKWSATLSFIYKPGGTGLSAWWNSAITRQVHHRHTLPSLLMLDIITDRAEYAGQFRFHLPALYLEEVYRPPTGPVSSAKRTH